MLGTLFRQGPFLMRKLLKSVISETEAGELLRDVGKRGEDWTHPIISKVLDRVKKQFPKVKAEGPAYWSIEATTGHTLHNDMGFKFNDDLSLSGGGHMKWCKYGASCLLIPPDSFKGGEFTYYDPEESPPVEDHYLGVVIHDSKQLHKVNSPKGRRVVLLMFFS
jgi:hypothetical protein